ATAPISTTCLEAEKPCAPALDGDTRPHGGDGLVGFVREVAHHLPADRRVRVKQPTYDRALRLRGFTFDGRHPLAPLRYRRETVLAVSKMLRSMEKWTGWDLNARNLLHRAENQSNRSMNERNPVALSPHARPEGRALFVADF